MRLINMFKPFNFLMLRTMKIKYNFLLLLVASFLLPAVVFADMAPDISVIGTLGVAQESNISLVRERVTFRIPGTVSESKKIVHASAVFWLKNPTNQEQTIQAIFPIYFRAANGDQTQYANNVTVKVDGKAVTATLKEGSYAVSIGNGEFSQQAATGYVFELTVPSNKIAKVNIRFDAPVGLQYRAGNLSLSYLLASGAGWNGKIGKAAIQLVYPFKLKWSWVSLDSDYGGNIQKRVSGRMALWNFGNFEPTRNQVIRVNFVAPSVAKTHPESNTAPIDPYAGGNP